LWTFTAFDLFNLTLWPVLIMLQTFDDSLFAYRRRRYNYTPSCCIIMLYFALVHSLECATSDSLEYATCKCSTTMQVFDIIFGSPRYLAPLPLPPGYGVHTPKCKFKYLGYFLKIWTILVEKWISYTNFNSILAYYLQDVGLGCSQIVAPHGESFCSTL